MQSNTNTVAPLSPSKTNPMDPALLFAADDVEEVRQMKKPTLKPASTGGTKFTTKPNTRDSWSTVTAPTAWRTKTRADLETAKKLRSKKVIAGRKALAPQTGSVTPSGGKVRSQPLDPTGKTKGTGTSVTVVKRFVKVQRPSPSTASSSSRASSAEVATATKAPVAQGQKAEQKAKPKSKAKDAAGSRKAQRKGPPSKDVSRGDTISKSTVSAVTATVATKDSLSVSSKTTGKATTKATTKRIQKAKVDWLWS